MMYEILARMYMQFWEEAHGILQVFHDDVIENLSVDRHSQGDSGNVEQGFAAMIPCHWFNESCTVYGQWGATHTSR